MGEGNSTIVGIVYLMLKLSRGGLQSLWTGYNHFKSYCQELSRGLVTLHHSYLGISGIYVSEENFLNAAFILPNAFPSILTIKL